MFALENLILKTQGVALTPGEVIPDNVLIKAMHEIFDNVKGARRYILLGQLHLARSDVMMAELEKIAKESHTAMALQIPELKKLPTTIPTMMSSLTRLTMSRYDEATRIDMALSSLMRERVLINQRYLDKVANDKLSSI